jgi:hypothetical protein
MDALFCRGFLYAEVAGIAIMWWGDQHMEQSMAAMIVVRDITLGFDNMLFEEGFFAMRFLTGFCDFLVLGTLYD